MFSHKVIMNLFHKRKPLNRIIIHKKNLLHNLAFFQSLHPNNTLFPVLKANAYGHGLVPIAKILQSYHTPYLVIDSMVEYKILKKHTSKKFLMLGETFPHNYKVINHKRVTPCVSSLPVLQELVASGKKRNIHLFLNTGMNREGVHPHQITAALTILKNTKITIEGVCSHLSCADNHDENSVQNQIRSFKEMYYQIIDHGHNPLYRHIGNSAATLKYQDDFFTSWRVGIGMYGYIDLDKDDPYFDKSQRLKPILEARSHITAIQDIATGEGTSYNKTRKTQKPTSLAVLPRGYNEGLPRIISNTYIATHPTTGKQYPQRGTICMNLCTIEKDNTLHRGDEITIISHDRDAPNSIQHIAQNANTIPYEILVGLDHTIKREII